MGEGRLAGRAALITGALYFDTTANEMRVWTGSAWKATGSAVNGTSKRPRIAARRPCASRCR